jgi:hypothetical protein
MGTESRRLVTGPKVPTLDGPTALVTGTGPLFDESAGIRIPAAVATTTSRAGPGA